MDEQRRLLDELMGQQRNLGLKEREKYRLGTPRPAVVRWGLA